MSGGTHVVSLFLVKDRDRTLWLAHESDAGQMFVFVPNTGRFHRNRGLSVDYYVEQDYTYEPIEVRAAAAVVREGLVGRLDGPGKADQLARYRADDAALDVVEVLGEDVLE